MYPSRVETWSIGALPAMDFDRHHVLTSSAACLRNEILLIHADALVRRT
jgi:hypothetical protein